MTLLGRWLVAALLGATIAACDAPAPRLSVLFVTLDTTRADALSCLGAPPGATPELDALAENAAIFTRARSDSNSTNPSHVTLMSGLRAIDHGVRDHVTRLPEGIATLPEVLQREGYATAGFPSVRHLGSDLGWRGFDVMPRIGRERSAAETTNLAISWLDEVGDRPFFLWVHYWEPHMDYEPPPELAARFYSGDREAGEGPRLAELPYFQSGPGAKAIDWLGDTRDPNWAPAMYAAEVHQTDAEFGRLLRAVEALTGGRALVVVTADHGESLGEHGIFYAHTGLYEQQLAVPLIIRLPGAPRVRSDAWVSGIDVAPTIADLVGVSLGASRPGRSLADVIRDGSDAGLAQPRVLVHHAAHNSAIAVRDGDWKLILPIDPDHRIYARPELFHLAEDPAEQNDLSEREPDRLAALRGAAQPWVARGALHAEGPSHLDEEAIARLRALGYLED